MIDKMGKHPEVITEMIQSIIYGSRMNNIFDEDLLRVLVTRVMSKNDLRKISENYPSLPDPMRSKNDAEKFLQKLSAVRNAGLLGLAKNAEKGLAEGVFKRSIGHLVHLSRQTQANTNEWLNAAKEMVKNFRSIFDRSLIGQLENFKPAESQSNDPLDAFITGEKRTCIEVFSKVMKTIKLFEEAISGIVQTEAIESANFLLNGNIPSEWERSFPQGPENPSDFINFLAQSAKYLFNSTSFSKIDVSKLFRPAALIISLQIREGAPLESVVKFSTSGSGVQLSGIILQGADFESRLQSAKNETSPKVSLPPLFISFQKSNSEDITLPLYSSKFHNF